MRTRARLASCRLSPPVCLSVSCTSFLSPVSRSLSLSFHRTLSVGSLAVGLQLGVGPLQGGDEAGPLGVLDDGRVAEVVLVPRLDAVGALGPHASHRLLHVHRPDVLQTGQADVQCAKRT